MRTIGITNQKGGSGKSTTAVNVSAALSEKGSRVCLLDMDPQSSASRWLGVEDAGQDLLGTFCENGDLGRLARPVENFDLIPCGLAMVGLDRHLGSEPGAETILRELLGKLPDRWDILLIDTPPTLSLTTISVLTASQELLIPVEVSVLAIAALQSLYSTIDRVRQRLNPGLKVLGLVPCRADFRTNLAREAIENLRTAFGDAVTNTVIRQRVALTECPNFGKSILSYDTESGAADDYRALAAELTNGRSRS